MRAILSDIHGNLEALTAVLADIARRGAGEVVNLSDTLGYGPDPVACLDLAMGLTVNLLGNFDYAVLAHADGFGLYAENSIVWSRAQLNAAAAGVPAGRWRGDFLTSLAPSLLMHGVLYVHGSARSPRNEYVFPEDIYNLPKMASIGAASGPLCFAGHTHVPGVFRECRPGAWEFLHPEECAGGLPVAGCKLIVNVGSVGQPRDSDERACYVTLEEGHVHFHRVGYDLEATVRKIRAVPELANFLGERLREGR